jgi:hypothetical protein
MRLLNVLTLELKNFHEKRNLRLYDILTQLHKKNCARVILLLKREYDANQKWK